MATTRSTASNRKTKGKISSMFDKAANNVGDVVDSVSNRLWEITR